MGSMLNGFGFRVYGFMGLGVRVQGLGLRGKGSGFRI